MLGHEPRNYTGAFHLPPNSELVLSIGFAKSIDCNNELKVINQSVAEAGDSGHLGHRNCPVVGEQPHLAWSRGSARYYGEVKVLHARHEPRVNRLHSRLISGGKVTTLRLSFNGGLCTRTH